MTPTVVVLGASGRLGRRLLTAFAAAGFDPIAVARTRHTGPPETTRWITVDLTTRDERTRLAATVATWTSGRERVCVVDVVLDRRSVEAMRHSVSAVTDTVLRLHDRLANGAVLASLVAASSTAVLAPGLYQTPYGLAKRHQVITYARSGLAGAALLLPALSQSTNTDGAGAAPWRVWSFEHAADRLVTTALVTDLHGHFTIHVPDLTPTPTVRQAGTRPPVVRDVLRAHLHSLLTDRNSMQAHRQAARARLGLSPDRIRQRVDHHFAPADLVQRFADRYQVSVIQEQSHRVPSSGERPTHA
ncbi:NAD-dependent epimerase/dehydratase family protein [Frankia sp. Cr1]|uniref:NAD-dependent epimerase/dehydratase family protein n=1 Tax=Frankia sp. Cr1 TaxID=3073931 RepID=UPI002AD545FB|nr:NAD-dependent epimerase/dehydratase family protein [Frankia sp. Cr1]